MTKPGIKCSKDCNFGCTQAAYDRAEKSGVNLANRLGAGWWPFTEENIGWYWGARKELMEVKPRIVGDTIEGTYPEPPDFTASFGGRYNYTDPDPKVAVDLSLSAARDEARAILREAEKVLPECLR